MVYAPSNVPPPTTVPVTGTVTEPVFGFALALNGAMRRALAIARSITSAVSRYFIITFLLILSKEVPAVH
jgi:hypothetical protein